MRIALPLLRKSPLQKPTPTLGIPQCRTTDLSAGDDSRFTDVLHETTPFPGPTESGTARRRRRIGAMAMQLRSALNCKLDSETFAILFDSVALFRRFDRCMSLLSKMITPCYRSSSSTPIPSPSRCIFAVGACKLMTPSRQATPPGGRPHRSTNAMSAHCFPINQDIIFRQPI
jgi:hypothetical protein